MTEQRTLGSKVASGTFWTVAMRMSIRLLGIVSVIILARILVPDDFGIVAQAAMFYSFVEMITAFGLESALIQNQGASAAHYNTVWTMNVVRGAANAAVLLAVAYPASLFLNDSRLAAVISFYALASFAKGFANIGTVDFRKHLDFTRDFQFELWTKVVGFIACITVAMVWRTYWAFVAGVLAGVATTVVTSYLMSSFRPRFSLSMWRPLFHFSKWIFGAELVGAVSNKLDVFLLSRFSTAGNVGIYTVAYEIAGTPSTEIAMPVARALMPGLSKLGDDPVEFRSLYFSTVSLVMLVAIPAGIGVSMLAEQITAIVLGQKWLNAIPLIEILALFGITRAVFSVSASAYMAFGRVDLLGKLAYFGTLLRVAGVSAGIHYGGMIGVAWGVLASSFCQMLLTLLVQDRAGILDVRMLLARSWRIGGAAAAMALGLKLTGLQMMLANFPPVIALASEVVFGLVMFVATLAALRYLGRSKQGPETVLFQYLKSRFQVTPSR